MPNLETRAMNWRQTVDFRKTPPLDVYPPCSDGGSSVDDADEIGRAVFFAYTALAGQMETAEMLGNLVRIHRALPGQGGNVLESGKFYFVCRRSITEDQLDRFERAFHIVTRKPTSNIRVVILDDAARDQNFQSAWIDRKFSGDLNLYGSKSIRSVVRP